MSTTARRTPWRTTHEIKTFLAEKGLLGTVRQVASCWVVDHWEPAAFSTELTETYISMRDFDRRDEVAAALTERFLDITGIEHRENTVAGRSSCHLTIWRTTDSPAPTQLTASGPDQENHENRSTTCH